MFQPTDLLRVKNSVVSLVGDGAAVIPLALSRVKPKKETGCNYRKLPLIILDLIQLRKGF